MVGGGIGTEQAKGIVGLNRGGDSIHNVSLPHRNPGHGRRTYYIMQPNVLLLPIHLDGHSLSQVAFTVHQHMHGKFRGALVPTGHPLHHWKVGLNDLLSLFEAFGQLIGVFGYPDEESAPRP